MLLHLEQVKTQNEKNYNAVEPNTLILDKLKSEMLKLAEKIAQNSQGTTNLNIENNILKRKNELEIFPSKCSRLAISSKKQESFHNEETQDLNESQKFQEITPENSPIRETKDTFNGYSIIELDDNSINEIVEEKEKKSEFENLFESNRFRNPQIGFTEQPIINELKQREQSAILEEHFPFNAIQLPIFMQKEKQ